MTKPTHPVDLLACAIATQEGFFAGSTAPKLRNNPGDLDYASQLGAQFPIGGGGIAYFDTLGHGIAAMYRQLWLQVAQGQTVRQIIEQWDEPDAVIYLKNVLAWTELPADVPVLDLLPPLVRLTA